MISLENAVVARLESFGERFEILVEPHLAARVRQGENINIEDVVAALKCIREFFKRDPGIR